MIDVIARCFSEGCGVSFEEALASPRYAEILSEELSLADWFPAATDEGAALRAGLFRMGTLLNTVPEGQAIAEARSSTPNQNVDFNGRTLIRLLGENIVHAADTCLPDAAAGLVIQWKEGDAEQQIEIAHALFDLLVGEDQKESGRELLSFSSVDRQINREIDINLQRDDQKVMPRAYGKWGDNTGSPNCQGKSQMLLAFAKRVGAPAFCVNTITSASVVKDAWRDRVAEFVKTDLMERNIENIDRALLESVQAFSRLRSFETMMPDFFHVGVTMQVRDGRWVLIDPHGLTWGEIPATYRMDTIARLLLKYGAVLPGLSLQGADHETAGRLFEERIQMAESFLKRSRTLEKALKGVTSPLEALQIFRDLGEPEFIARQEGLWKQMSESPELMEAFTALCFFGEATENPMAMFDPGYLPRRVGSMITYHHAEVMNLFKDQVTTEGKLIHPECEFTLPEYHIAISMINSLSLDARTPAMSAFFMAHSFDQLTFYNTLTEGMPNGWQYNRERDPELAQAAMQALVSLNLMHSNCKERIRRYFGRQIR